MINNIKIRIQIFFNLIISFAVINAQQFEQHNSIIEDYKTNQPFDLVEKANELGISADQLQGILNSATNNGGGDPLPDAMQERIFTGQATGDDFGVSVSSAGDVNGDGYSDIIIGAYNNDVGGSGAGRAYIYFGGSTMNSAADVILTGAAANDFFGFSVSTAGDVNGDGYSDVIVGAYANDAGGNSAGRAYIYFGGSTMNNAADVILTGAAALDQFGYSVAGAGDVNGDGYCDVIVGAYGNDAGGSLAGRAYIYFGNSTMNNVEDVILTGATANDFFGYSVSSTGDVNGDGYSDVIVGAPTNDAGGSNAGRAYMYFGGSTMNNVEDVILTGAASSDQFGYSVSSAEDVNGDGYSDVIVGANGNDAGGSSAGRAYIYFGGSTMNNVEDVILTGAAASDLFGSSVSTTGDVNGDGYSDVIVGATDNDAGGTSAGRAYIYFGGSTMDNIEDVILTGAAANDNFGVSVSTAGDVNGDGYTEVIVGANNSDAGKAYLFMNSLTGTDLPDEFFTGTAASDQFGHSVSGAGDVNGDGYSDVIVGAYNNDAGGTSAGRAYIYFSGSNMDNVEDVILTGAAASDNFGVAVSTAGDVNGDGYSDVIVGADGSAAGGTNTGRAYIYFGGSTMNNVEDVILTGAAAGDLFGVSVSTAGDVNGDGYSDVIVGASGNDAGGSDAGRAYIYFGGSTMDNSSDVILTGAAAVDQFGVSVSGAGDVNGDGYGDVIVGAYGNDAGGTSAGRAYIYFGGSNMNNVEDVILTGAAASDQFGASVSTAGDVNGDGYSDVIVGAFLNDAGGIDAGRAYIYFGGSTMNNVEDLIITGVDAGDYFGYSVSSAGDVNGDGYSDVIVGAYNNDAAGSSAGRAYIYFGGSTMNNVEDAILTGVAAADQFGASVSTVGDVNGDGYSDVIVGARNNDAGGTNAGRAYLYLSSPPSIQPYIKNVKDIPFDQGGYVRVIWLRSGYDIPGQNRIADYILQRSDPPGQTGYVWDYVATIPAIRTSEYSYVSPTPYDSMSNSSGTFYFRVIAHGINQDENWYSNIKYGHSVDNLSPSAPMNFYANLINEDVKLGWKINTESDLKDYVIYRTDYPNANPDTLSPLTQLLDTTYIDTSPLPGTSYYYLRAQDVHNNFSETVSVTVSEQTTFALSVSVANGWNMVSIPGLHPVDQNVNTWWQYRDLSANVFKYSSGYLAVSEVTPGTGYWMKHSGQRIYNTGEEWPAIQISNHQPINGAAGWNLIGGYEDVVPTSALTTNPPGLISGQVFGYSGGYYTAANLEPGYGYWVKLTGAGEIIIPEALTKGTEAVEWFREDWGRIILTDASGKKFTLYSVTGEVNLAQYDLPPLPPAGMIDIRYSSGRIAEELNSGIKTIELSGVTYPLTVRVEDLDIRLTDETGNVVNVNLKSGEEFVISDASVMKLMVTGELIPAEYALEQNYPNPFNPSTKIQYSIPQRSNVSLKVYDVLGNEVATLINEEKERGVYTINFDASQLASGMYLYRLQAGSFVETKKMLLLK